MPKKELRVSIEQLRVALDDAENQPMEPQARAELIDLLARLQQTVADDAVYSEAQHRPLVEQLEESVWRFEKSHPTLTVIVGRIMDSLNRMGV